MSKRLFLNHFFINNSFHDVIHLLNDVYLEIRDVFYAKLLFFCGSLFSHEKSELSSVSLFFFFCVTHVSFCMNYAFFCGIHIFCAKNELFFFSRKKNASFFYWSFCVSDTSSFVYLDSFCRHGFFEMNFYV